MANRILIQTGNDFFRTFTATLDTGSGDAAEDLSSADSIYASVVYIDPNDPDNSIELIADTLQTDTDGANWANGIIGVAFSDTQTATIDQAYFGLVYISVTVNIDGKKLGYELIPAWAEEGWTLS